jgi:hypothetical protein
LPADDFALRRFVFEAGLRPVPKADSQLHQNSTCQRNAKMISC